MGAQIFAKPPRLGRAVPWHQDGRASQAEQASASGLTVVTMWIALDDCDASTGAMRVLPAMHGAALPTAPRCEYAQITERIDSAAIDDALRAGKQARDPVFRSC